MLASERTEQMKIVKSFEKKTREVGFEFAGRRVYCGPMAPRETIAVKKLALSDPEMLAVAESDEPLENIGALLFSEGGYRLLAALLNMRLVEGEPLTPEDLLEILDSTEEAVELLTVLTAGKTLETLNAEQRALEAERAELEAVGGEDSPNVSAPETTSAPSSVGTTTPAPSSPA